MFWDASRKNRKSLGYWYVSGRSRNTEWRVWEFSRSNKSHCFIVMLVGGVGIVLVGFGMLAGGIGSHCVFGILVGGVGILMGGGILAWEYEVIVLF